MRTFKVSIHIEGKITIPDSLTKELRAIAAEEPVDGGPDYLHKLHKEFYEDDDAFLQRALKHALRNIARAGVVNDLGGLGDGVGVRCAPATVEVSVPENVVTRVKAREQVGVDRIDVQHKCQGENCAAPEYPHSEECQRQHDLVVGAA